MTPREIQVRLREVNLRISSLQQSVRQYGDEGGRLADRLQQAEHQRSELVHQLAELARAANNVAADDPYAGARWEPGQGHLVGGQWMDL